MVKKLKKKFYQLKMLLLFVYIKNKNNAMLHIHILHILYIIKNISSMKNADYFLDKHGIILFCFNEYKYQMFLMFK